MGGCLYAGRQKEILITGCLMVFLLYAAGGNCTIRNLRYQACISELSDQTGLCVLGTVSGIEQKSDQYIYDLRNCYIVSDLSTAGSCGNIQFYYENDDIPIGSEVMGSGQYELFDGPANEGNFDAAGYYKSQKITCRVFGTDLTVKKYPTFRWRQSLYLFQKKVSAVFESELSAQDAGILCTMVLGNKSCLDSEIKEMYQSSGISHILAISGLHISVLGISVFQFLRKRTGSYPLVAIAGSVVVISFAVMSGFGTSSKRACIMYLVMMGAMLTGRKYEMSHAIALSALVILIRNPFALFQSGFQFSFISMIAILFLGGIQTANEKGRDRKKIKKKQERLKNSLISGAVMQLWLLPVTAWYYYEVPIYALFLNLLVLPLCGYLLGMGMTGGIVGIWFTAPSKWLLILCHLILKFYYYLMEFCALLPFHQIITGRPSAVWMLLYYLVLILVCLRQSAFRGVGFRRKGGGRVSFFLKKVRGRKQLLIPAGMLILMFLLPAGQDFRIDFLDVGQGDGICISEDADFHVFIDGGSTSEDQVGTYRILPFLKYHKIRRINLWIVTHTDKDHISGLEEILEAHYPIEKILFYSGIEQDEAWNTITELADENGTDVEYVQADDAIQYGDMTMKCIFPESGQTSEDKNDLCQVWLLTYEGEKVLLTGDVGEAGEETMEKNGVLEDVDVLKVAHHGSKYSSSEAFLEAVKPELAIISCGLNNRYGHPHQETLDRLSEAGSRIYRTDRQGQITLSEKNGSWMLYFPVKN